MRDGYHWAHGLYFRRIPDSSVEITQTKHGGTDEIEWQTIVPPTEWASIVAAVSYQGETVDTHRTALGFHGARFEGLVRNADLPQIFQKQESEIEQLRQRNCDLSHMAGERDILLKAVQGIAEYDDGTKLVINGECGEMARKAIEEWTLARRAVAPSAGEEK